MSFASWTPWIGKRALKRSARVRGRPMLARSCTILPPRGGSCVRPLRLQRAPVTVATMEPLEELRLLITRHAGVGQPATATSGIRAVLADAPTELAHHVLEPTFAVVAQGAKRAFLGYKVF